MDKYMAFELLAITVYVIGRIMNVIAKKLDERDMRSHMKVEGI